MTRCTFGGQRPQSIKTIAQYPSVYDSFVTMTDLSNVTHLLFDHDGVLVDTEYWFFKATQDELAAMDIRLTLDEYMDHMVKMFYSLKMV